MALADADALNATMLKGLESGAPVVDAGKFLIVHRRQPDGSWRYGFDCFNSSLPPQAT